MCAHRMIVDNGRQRYKTAKKQAPPLKKKKQEQKDKQMKINYLELNVLYRFVYVEHNLCYK